jgi:hypothetical protein
MNNLMTTALPARFSEKLEESLQAPIPDLTPRQTYGRTSMPGKATAVVGMTWLRKCPL